MKTETIGNRSQVRMFVIVMLATCAFAAAANAQSSFTGRFTLPYEVHWGAAVLPAGEYTITMDTFHTVTLVQSASNNQSFYTRMPMIDDSTKGPASLSIAFLQGERRVRSLNLPGFGKSLIYEPLTKAEREQLAKGGQVQAVPVIIARK